MKCGTVRKFLKLDSIDQIKELTRKRAKHPLPVHKVGRVIRFWKSEVIRWFNESGSGEPVSHATKVKLSKAMRRRLDAEKKLAA
jgi:hypothetical protein